MMQRGSLLSFYPTKYVAGDIVMKSKTCQYHHVRAGMGNLRPPGQIGPAEGFCDDLSLEFMTFRKIFEPSVFVITGYSKLK